ncbi:MAG TPA: hypothetical protein VK586_21670 [Streptosporangiaceae bacterium]|nr:hypothetical protein [Streptosporangiaceae bacterium]
MAVVETKVKSSAAAAAVSGLALWAIGRYVFNGSGVPDVVASWVYVIVPGIITFAAGYLARHTAVAADLPLALVGTTATIASAPASPEVSAAGYPAGYPAGSYVPSPAPAPGPPAPPEEGGAGGTGAGG